MRLRCCYRRFGLRNKPRHHRLTSELMRQDFHVTREISFSDRLTIVDFIFCDNPFHCIPLFGFM